MWGMRMVSEDYLGLNDQLVLAVSHSKLLKSHLSFNTGVGSGGARGACAHPVF